MHCFEAPNFNTDFGGYNLVTVPNYDCTYGKMVLFV